ncbi:MAG: hypothetical protein AseanaTS_09140 [Candidatus Pelagadaptatus aseana]|uniref:PilZ domain-containing protein n=1 Tax=Candidatus Pelagadaptatus aseana TaxID=3120508 RepID=UPI0039B1E81E
MTNPDTPHRRHLHRYELTCPVEVFDLNSGALLGSLVNIHEEGLLIVGTDAIAEDHVYQLVLRLPDTVKNIGEIRLGVDCLWVGDAQDATMRWSGCQIIDLSAEARDQIRQLIEQVGRQS